MFTTRSITLKRKRDEEAREAREARADEQTRNKYAELMAETNTRKRHVRALKSFVKSWKTKPKSQNFIMAECKQSYDCIAFGRYADQISNLFNNFTDFKYATDNIYRIGQLSRNGIILKIPFEREGYVAETVLKSAIISSYTADNLLYEYIVGDAYVNNKAKYFPCFVKTYGLFYHSNLEAFTALSSLTNKPISSGSRSRFRTRPLRYRKELVKKFLDQLKLEPKGVYDFDKGCKHFEQIAILIEFLNKPLTLGVALFDDEGGPEFYRNLLLPILVMLYQTLDTVRDTFVHRDLHAENILLFAPGTNDNDYVTVHYHDSNDLVYLKLNTKYIPKMIDYGRSYFYASNDLNSNTLHDEICEIPACGANCGSTKGLSLKDLGPDHYKDVEIIEKIENFHQSDQMRTLKRSILDQTCDPVTTQFYFLIKKFDPSSYFSDKTVTELYEDLSDLMKSEDGQAANINYYSTKTKIADLHVYDHRPMEYIPVSVVGSSDDWRSLF